MNRSLPVPGTTALDVVAELLEFAVGRLEAKIAFDSHDDGSCPCGAGLRVHGACRRRCPARHVREQARRHHQQPAEHHRRQRRDLGFELQVLQPLLEPALEVIGPLARLGRVELGVGLAGPLLKLELLGAVVPVGDLLGQPVLHRDFGLGDELEFGVPHLLEMFRHDLGDGVALRLLLDLASDPRALGPIEDRLHARFALGQRPVVEVGRVVEVAGRPVGVELDVEHPLGDDATLARAGEARVLDRMLDVEQHPRPSPWVALVQQAPCRA